jgi:multiple sugar transport system ATP-binding protein
MAALTINNVVKNYGQGDVLKGINIAIDSGEFLILVGPSGCGKSTLMNMIAGLETVTSGEILMGDDDVTHVEPKDRDIAMVFQSYALYPNMSVAQNIAFGLEIRKVPKPERAKEVARVAKLLQIEHLLDRKPGQLSGGQRQRVAMGRALARRPRLYLFDEPLSNLDAKLRVEMRTEIKKLHQNLGTTIVYVTHDQIEAMTLADRIAVMKDGIVQQFGTPQEIYDNPANQFVAGFMGSPAMNFIPVRLSGADGAIAVEVADANGKIAHLPVPRSDKLQGMAGREVILGLRPEKITEPLPYKEGEPMVTHLQMPVLVTEPTGADTMVVSQLNGVQVDCRLGPRFCVKPGSVTELMVDMSLAVFFDKDSGARIDL